MPTPEEIQDRIETQRLRLYNAEALAQAARICIEESEHSQEHNIRAAGCVLEELETLISTINEGLDSTNLQAVKS